jgi:signal transduction histidine kinase
VPSEALWGFFVVAALGLTILVVALGAALVIAQHRFLKLHQAHGRHLLAAQDEERAWVAREVHDDVVQRLAVFRHELAMWESDAGGLTELQRRRLSGLKGEIEDLSVALRALAHRLHPSTIDTGNLRLALEQLAEETERVYGLQVEMNLATMPAVSATDQVLAVYRISQEALRNVARHAGVDRARLTVSIEDDDLALVIRDEGKGFDPESRRRVPRNGGAGLGLLTILERARLVGGSASISSRPGAGTTVRVTIPLRASHA